MNRESLNALYSDVTSQIVASLESSDTPPWKKPWQSGDALLPLRYNGQPYRGANTLMLWLTAEARGFESAHWLTFRQCQELGGHVKRGEKGTPVIYCEPIRKTETAEDGEEITSRFWITKGYVVFNASQCESLPEKYTIKAPTQLDPAQRIQHAEAFLANTGADIRIGGGSAFYRPSDDFIQLPEFERFEAPESFYATGLHELCHWTGHGSRLNRTQKFGGDEYGREELVAELGAAFLCASLSLHPVTKPDHESYLAGWIRLLREDSKAIFIAAAQAQSAADYLQNLQPKI